MQVNILFLLAIIVTIFLSRHEINRYHKFRSTGSVTDFERQRFRRRMAGTSVLTLLLALTYFAYAKPEAFIGHPWLFALFWASCFLLLILLAFLVLMDVRAIFQKTMKSYLDEGSESERLEKFLAKGREKLEQKN